MSEGAGTPSGPCLGLPGVSLGLGVGARSRARVSQRPWAEAGLALHMAAASAKPPRAGRSPQRQWGGQAGSGGPHRTRARGPTCCVMPLVCCHRSPLRLRPGITETPSAQEAGQDALTPIPLLSDPFHKRQSLLGVLGMDALHGSRPGTRGGTGWLCRWPELPTGVHPGCPPCSLQQGPEVAGRSCWPPGLGGRPRRSWRPQPQAPHLG